VELPASRCATSWHRCSCPAPPWSSRP
jgi:hypothetical protein